MLFFIAQIQSWTARFLLSTGGTFNFTDLSPIDSKTQIKSQLKKGPTWLSVSPRTFGSCQDGRVHRYVGKITMVSRCPLRIGVWDKNGRYSGVVNRGAHPNYLRPSGDDPPMLPCPSNGKTCPKRLTGKGEVFEGGSIPWRSWHPGPEKHESTSSDTEIEGLDTQKKW